MSFQFYHRRAGYTIVEMIVATGVGSICLVVVFALIWGGSRLISRNVSLNLAHLNVVSPMQRISDDIHMSLVTPQLTGTLAAGATGTVPGGYGGGGTKAWRQGKMTNQSWNFPIVSSAGPAEGFQVYLMASMQNAVASTFGSYNSSNGGFVVSNGSYLATATTIALEVPDSASQALVTSATNGMRLCIPSACVLLSGTNYAMVDRKITAVSISGSLGASGTSSNMIATCTLSAPLGTLIQSAGTRIYSSSAVVTAYLVTPVNYFVCGTDLIRLNCDGNWQVVMKNVLSTNSSLAQAKPFSMPWPYTQSFLSSANDGVRAINIRLVASNAEYATSGTNSQINNIYRGANADMVLYDLLIWSRMQLFDEVVR